MFSGKKILLLGYCLLFCVAVSAQSRRNIRITENGGAILSVVASRANGSADPIKLQNLYFYLIIVYFTYHKYPTIS